MLADSDPDLLALLEGGDRRSIGRADEVVAEVLDSPGLFGQLVDGMLADDPVVRMRAADAAEKVTVERPELLAQHKKRLLGEVAAVDQQEVRWHVAQMLPRLDLDPDELDHAVRLLLDDLEQNSSILRVSAMQSLADLADRHAHLRATALPVIERAIREGTPAMRARGRRLLSRHESVGEPPD